MDEAPRNAEPNQPSGATALTTRPQPAPPRVDSLPPFRVLLHNDDVNNEVHVVETLIDLTPLNVRRAMAVMVEAHTTGVALVLVTHRERAELYVDQFRTKNLTVTIEPAE